MSHPLEDLAPYVDGSLPDPERADIDRHLTSCARCRSEVSLASEARRQLRAMPVVPVPAGLGDRALREMRSPSQPRWTKLAPLAAAAAVVVLLAIALPRIGGSDGSTSASSDEGAAFPTTASGDLRLEVIDADFDAESLQAEARAFADKAQAAEADAEPSESAQVTEATAKVAGPVRSAAALECLNTGFPGALGNPVRIVEASFEGTPAYVAFVVERSDSGEAPDTLRIWVARRLDCSSLSLASVEI